MASYPRPSANATPDGQAEYIELTDDFNTYYTKRRRTVSDDGAVSFVWSRVDIYSTSYELAYDGTADHTRLDQQNTSHDHLANPKPGFGDWSNTTVRIPQRFPTSTTAHFPHGSIPGILRDGVAGNWSIASCSEQHSFASRTPNFTLPICSTDEGVIQSKEPQPPVVDSEPPSQVCFGMINTLSAEIFPRCPIAKTARRHATLSSDSQLTLVDSFTQVLLDPTSAEVLRRLSEDDAIDMQIFVSNFEDQSNTLVLKQRGSGKLIVRVSVIIYGPPNMFDDIGNFFQDCELYLQDPIGCDRNVQYLNPHRLSSPEDQPQMTSDLFSFEKELSIYEQAKSDMILDMVTPRDFPMLETPSDLRTSLLPHQKQALFFMTERELGWNFGDADNDVWGKSMSAFGPIYFNNITGSQQPIEPPSFRGGVLADSMGLGKSCSMIALIANEFATIDATASRPSSEVMTTLLVVPLPLIQTWEDQFQKHLRSPASFAIKRYHGTKRLADST
ncbi:SNF2 family N-terminal domain-domain-containing protein [Clohesyomyces aquaticus]|uniref:SNF2 family N-terminal domain-domain-containing protein n=1 Tax=Clohesyomyces aquaticus TaxID=1231657 RepID=A0A1Y1ZS41_9PLEO|nr:SNF2 family N-terminal domain-domain-containing protein [Clohesyomyces aquaticus]